MKNLFKNLMLVAVAAMGFTACEQVNDDVNATNETFTVNIVGEFADDTRSGFLEKEEGATAYKSAWEGGETAVFSVDEETLVSADNTYTGGNKALFAPEFTTTGPTIYAFSPKYVANKCLGGISGINTKYRDVYVTIPAEQTPEAVSVDPAAHILAGEADYAENVNMSFGHVLAYGKMTITNFNNDIKKVVITASEPLVGSGCYYYYADNDYDNKKGDLANVKEYAITINADNVVDNVFWFGCAPADLTGTTLKVKIYSGEDTYTRDVEISKTLKFQQGRVSAFNVSFKDVAKDEITVNWVNNAYNLVKSAAHLEVGDKVIIVAAGFDAALSTTQNTNNRAQANVIKAKDVDTDVDTVTFSNDVQILTLEEGTTEGTYAFNTGSGYLYAASSSSNHLKTETKLSANSSFTITIDENGVATVKAQGSYTRNWMRYNSTNNPPIFSCYGSGQADICIYKLVGEYTPTVPSISYTVANVSVAHDATSGEATVKATNGDGWNFSATTDAPWVDELTYVNSKITFVVDENESEKERTATVNVTATKEGYDPVTATFTITQGVKPVEGSAKTYTFTITKADFNTASYAANNNEKTSTATASDGTTMEVKWTSYQVMQQNNTMQWQKSKGYIFNSTDLGTIDSVTIDKADGTFTTYKGSSQQPTSNGTGGYFQIKVGGATGKVNSIKVTFTK